MRGKMADQNKKDKRQKFLREYEKLVREYGYYITACGCCSSPWAIPLEPESETVESHMEHLRTHSEA
jgi:sugar phosphate isomerase/epimerase